VAQHLVTLNKIVFNTGGFSGSECTKIVFVFGRGSVPEPDGKGDAVFPFPFPSTHSASQCPVGFCLI